MAEKRDIPARADWEPTCGCHPDYHELGVHAPGWRPDPVPERSAA